MPPPDRQPPRAPAREELSDDGQTLARDLAPPPAERARTIVEYGEQGRLRMAWASGLGEVRYIPDENGEPWLLLPDDRSAGWPDGDRRLSGVLYLDDPADGSRRRPDGGRLTSTGVRVLLGGRLGRVSPDAQTAVALALAELRPVGALLDVGHGMTLHHLAVEEIRLVGGGPGTGTLDLTAYAVARPDPVRPHAADVLAHLDSAHRRQLRAILAAHLGRQGGWAPAEVSPVAIDRYGIELAYRAEPAGGPVLVRVPFQAPIRSIEALGAAVRAITPCACRPDLDDC
jgi:hypothetical protein